ncbi:DUF6954 family protein [Thalassobacillus pellis]|uniref:DUF6954 family protein n=1 Tax=Thalassobacillus pellis TaxID=748008 RepID=UPI001960E3D1|nr:hypothetical protein [Thalassobacillus pellis]MBM7551166.1 hypothetical protein [Thalassobacillus pellis]
MKVFIYAIFIAGYAAITFFGLGPVIFADGSKQERMLTLVVVAILYNLLTFLFIKWKKRT